MKNFKPLKDTTPDEWQKRAKIAAELVFCKDCKHARRTGCDGMRICGLVEDFNRIVKADEYCSRGCLIEGGKDA